MRTRSTLAVVLTPLALAACLEGLPADPSADEDEASEGELDQGDDTDDGEPAACAAGPRVLGPARSMLLPLGSSPRGVTLGDVDGDGALDVIATARDDQQLWVFRGRGDGSFAAPTITPLAEGTNPEALRGGAIADGVFDVVARASSDSLALVRLRGDGSGGFYDDETLPVSSPMFTLARATDDAALDLIVAAPATLLVYAGEAASESFMAADPISSTGAWSSPGPFGLGDFDNDGDLDLALASSGGLHVGTNDGAARFEFAPALAFEGNASDVHAGDVDDDGDLEIVLTTFGDPASDAGHLFRGRGDGSFEADELIPAPLGPICLDLADLDEDGRDDVVMIGTQTLSAYRSTASGFELAMEIACAGQNPRQLELGDLDGDCIEDAVTATDSGVCVMLSAG